MTARDSSGGMPSRGAMLALAAIFAIALALRLAWLAQTDTELLPMSDPQYYHATAVNLAGGRGYSVAVDPTGAGFIPGPESEATAFWAPGYPFALAPLYWLFGDDQRIAKGFNAVVGALTVLPVFYLAWRLGGAGKRTLTIREWSFDAPPAAGEAETREMLEFSRLPQMRADATGLTAAALFAVMPSLVYWTASLFSEPLFTFGIAATLALAAWGGDRDGRARVAACFAVGLALIATSFVRSQGTLMFVPVAVLLVRSFDVRALLRTFAPVAAGVALVVVPWAIRNEMAMGRPWLINSNLGYNMRIAHAEYSTGTSVPPDDLWGEQPGISFKEREILFDDLGRERAIEYAREHPGREIELAVKRVGYLSRSDAEAAVQWSESLGATQLAAGDRGLWIMLGDLFWYPLLILALLSLVVVPRTRMAWAMWSAVGVWVLLHTVFAGEPRYHVPVVPALAVLAAATLVRAWELLPDEERA